MPTAEKSEKPPQQPPVFGGLLRSYRELAGLSQEQLAERSGVSAKAIGALERSERRRPYPHTLDLLVTALDLGVNQRRALVAAAVGSATPPASVVHLVPSPLDAVSLFLDRTASKNNLPTPLSSFVGRAAELAEITRLLPTTRLFTLTGSGGCGKTRLALQVGSDLLPDYPDGVWLVELAPIADPALVAPTVAAVLGIQSSASRSLLDHLVDVLRSRRLLLLLDNCEHLLDASARLVDAILRGCPSVHLLATSREPLNIGGEVSWLVPSLALPPADPLPPIPNLVQIEAVRLFLDRANAVRPGFALTSQNASAVALICRRLDGIPLALELAAARLRGLSAEQLVSRLDQRFRLLTGGSRTALPRQQTLAAAVAWRYDLLTPAEQTLFNRLAVFLDSFTLEGAEAICSDTQLPIPREDVLDLLLRLVEKSLVVAEPGEGGVSHYRLLETLRQYAREKLLATSELEAVSRRHAGFYLALAEQAEPELHGPEQADWFDRLEREHNNLRAAIEGLTANDQGVDALRLAGAISWFWAVRGYYAEGRARLGNLLEGTGAGASPILRAKACAGLAYLAFRQGDLSQALMHAEAGRTAATEAGDKLWMIRHMTLFAYTSHPGDRAPELERALPLIRQAGPRWAVGQVLFWLSSFRFALGDLAGAASAQAEGVAVSQEAGDAWTNLVWARMQHVRAMHRGEYARARALAEESGRIAWRLGDRSSQANALMLGGEAAVAEGDRPAALSLLSEGRAIYRDVADRFGLSWASANLSETRLLQGELAAAGELAAESLGLARESAFPYQTVDALRVSAEVALARGDPGVARSQLHEAAELCRDRLPESLPLLLDTLARVAVAANAPARARRLAAAAGVQRTRLGLKMRPIDETRLALALQEAQPMLSDAERSAAWAEGEAMTLEQAIAYALEPG